MSNITKVSYSDIFSTQIADMSFKDIIEASERLVVDLKPLSTLRDEESYFKLAEIIVMSILNIDKNKRFDVVFLGDKYDIEKLFNTFPQIKETILLNER